VSGRTNKYFPVNFNWKGFPICVKYTRGYCCLH